MKMPLLPVFGLLCASIVLADWTFAPKPVNSGAGEPNPHWNSGGRRMVRINTRIMVLAPTSGGGEKIWRSGDNGSSWKEIDNDGAYSGSLVSGPDSMVYHFYIDRSAGRISMVKFRYDAEVIPAPVEVYTAPALRSSAVIEEYRSLCATVDSSGNLYVASHWGSGADVIYALSSEDGGKTWSQPMKVSSEGLNWFYPIMEVDLANRIQMTYQEHNGSTAPVMLATSSDLGRTWTNKMISSKIGSTYHANPSPLTAGRDTIFVFVQGESPNGLLVSRSVDGGKTFGSFSLIEPTCGYGDPGAALGADGRIYVAFRSSRNTGAAGSCGDMSREKVMVSADHGATWKAVDSLYSASRTGTRSQMRYQTWWNYGGPLEWIWMQYDASGQPIYYDMNGDVAIASRNSKPGSSTRSIKRGGSKGAAPRSGMIFRPGNSPSAPGGEMLFRIPGMAEASTGALEFRVHDDQGRMVRTIPVTPSQESGTLGFDGRDGFGRPLPPGGYFCRILGPSTSESAWRLLLLR